MAVVFFIFPHWRWRRGGGGGTDANETGRKQNTRPSKNSHWGF